MTLSEEFSFAATGVTVEAIQGFTVSKPTFTKVSTQTIEIANLNAVQNGTSVEFKVSQLYMPRFQGSVPNAIQVSVNENGTNQVIDRSDLAYFVQDATSWDILSLTLSSRKNRAPTEIKVAFNKVQSQISVYPDDSLVLSLPQEVKVNSSALSCLIDDIEKPCEYSAPNHGISIR